MTNSNHTKLGEVSEKIETLESIVREQEKELRKANVKIEVLTDGLTAAEKQLKEQQEQIIKLLKAIAKREGKKAFEGLEEAEEMEE